jgi:hypothetical protein
MNPGFIRGELRRTLRNQLLLLGGLAVVALLVPVIATPLVTGFSLRQWLCGPSAITIDDIASLQSSWQAPSAFVRVDFARFDNWRVNVTGGRDHLNDFYYAARAPGDRYVIVKTDTQDLPASLVGGLRSVQWAIESNVLEEFSRKVRGTAAPVMLDASDHTPGVFVPLLIAASLLILSAWQARKELREARDPAKNGMLRQLAKVGDVEEMALAVDAEVSEGLTSVGRLRMTRSWLIERNWFRTDLLYLGDVAWAYRYDAGNPGEDLKVSGPAIVMYDFAGSRRTHRLPAREVEQLLAELRTRLPWVIVGFEAELLARWQKDPKEAFADVQERKRQLAL